MGIYGQQTSKAFTYLMMVGIIYPSTYDLIQLYKEGFEYFQDSWNYNDILFTMLGLANIVFQFTLEPSHLNSTLSMSFVLLLALCKTLFFLRIFDNLSYLVTMIRSVIYDLRIFLIFYTILLFMFSLILGVLGFQNFSNDPELWDQLQQKGVYPGVEYSEIGRFFANIVSIIRMSMGDFDVNAIVYMDQTIARVFWFMWITIVLVTAVIFLNFIVAEASASYEKISANIANYLQYEKIELINESE